MQHRSARSLRGFALAAAALALVLGSLAPDARAEDRDPQAAQAAELVSVMKSGDPVEKVQAALDAVENPHPSLLKPLLRLLSDAELGVREAAIKALATRTGKDKKKAAAGLNPRLARLSRKATDRAELLLVIEALDKLAQRSSIKPLVDGIDIHTDQELAEARLNAVASVPHADAIERLIQFLAKGRRGGARAQRNAAAQSLQYATGVKMGHDPDRWRAWWRENKKTFSFEDLARARAEAEEERKAAAKKREERKAEREKRRKEGAEKKRKKKKDPGDSGGGSKPEPKID